MNKFIPRGSELDVSIKMLKSKIILFDGILFVASVAGGLAFLIVGGLFLLGAIICGIVGVYGLGQMILFGRKGSVASFKFSIYCEAI